MRALTFRNPWGFLIANSIKIVENRRNKLGEKDINRWICIHIAQKFGEQQKKWAKECFESKMTKEFIQNFDTKEWTDIYNDNEQLTSNKLEITKEDFILKIMEKQCGNVIGFFKVEKCIKSIDESKKIDKLFTDWPNSTSNHYVIKDTIMLKRKQYIKLKGKVTIFTVSDPIIDDKLVKLLNNINKKVINYHDNNIMNQKKSNSSFSDNSEVYYPKKKRQKVHNLKVVDFDKQNQEHKNDAYEIIKTKIPELLTIKRIHPLIIGYCVKLKYITKSDADIITKKQHTK